MASGLAEMYHHKRHLLRLHIGSFLAAADVVVLAEAAQEIARTDKDRS
jgi:hypothetical protein